MTIADLLVLPFRPSSYDVWTLGALDSLIAEMRAVNSRLRVIAFLNQADHVGQDNAQAAEMLREAENVKLGGFSDRIPQSVSQHRRRQGSYGTHAPGSEGIGRDAGVVSGRLRPEERFSVTSK